MATQCRICDKKLNSYQAKKEIGLCCMCEGQGLRYRTLKLRKCIVCKQMRHLYGFCVDSLLKCRGCITKDAEVTDYDKHMRQLKAAASQAPRQLEAMEKIRKSDDGWIDEEE